LCKDYAFSLKGPKIWGELKIVEVLCFIKGPKIWGILFAFGPKIKVVIFGPFGILLSCNFSFVGGDGGEREK
jgi:hypothetical protein